MEKDVDTFDYEFLRFSRQEGVATITLNRPERRNALNQGIMREMVQVLEMCQQDAATRAVVLTGAGGHFS
ncbi:MAG: enoyl-CoA hydratase/isomerase family protein, partial [Euryarchaeota archaeon]|nr:enoyl-CoA hydratase/isomerase family protein [Euryarchaeota archaeon]